MRKFASAMALLVLLLAALFAANSAVGSAGHRAVSWGGMAEVEPRTDAALVDLTREACARVVPITYCRNLPVRVDTLPEGTAAEARFVSETAQFTSGDPTETLTSTEVVMSVELRTMPDQYVRHVATHEWNHIRQFLLKDTPSELAALEAQANEHFAARATAPLTGDQGLELLTDCQTVLGHKQLMGREIYEVTPYVDAYLHATSMREACGEGWERVLTDTEFVKVDEATGSQAAGW